MAGLRSSRQTLTPNSSWDKDLWPLIPAEQFSPAQIIAINVKSVNEVDERSTSFFCEVRSSAADAACFREDSALFVRSGPLPPFPASPANAELVSCGPFPYSFEGTRYRKRPPMVRGASSERINKKRMQKNCTPTINSRRQSNHNYLISIRRVAGTFSCSTRLGSVMSSTPFTISALTASRSMFSGRVKL